MSDALSHSYQTRLVTALRRRDVSGTRIGEILAEIESHLAESGESVTDAFGSPEDYAARLVESTPARDSRTPFAWLLPAVLPLGLAGGVALAEGAYRLGAGGRTDWGWFEVAPLAQVGIGAALLAILVLLVRPHVDRIVDPRTRRPVRLPSSARLALVAMPGTMLAALWVLGRYAGA